ncbi:MAG: hypothetical protein NZM06_04610 [Chloroherpetonaceae bacterium]|nr:hypothetical protein [Chloroherpetonaceae bacterium]
MNLNALLYIEYLKTSRAASFWASLFLFAFFGSLILTFNFYGTVVVNGQEVAATQLPRDWEKLLSQFKSLQVVFVPISLILLAAGEFAHKTARQNVIDGLSKEEFVAGKVFVALALALVYFLLALSLSALFNLGAKSDGEKALIGAKEFFLFCAYFAALLGYGFLGLFLAFLTRSSGSAIAFYVLYLVLEGLAGGLLQLSPTLKPLVKFLPTKVFDDLVNPFRFDAELLQQFQWQIQRSEAAGESVPDAVYGQLPRLETPSAFSLAFLYVALTISATYFLFKRRDL